MLIIRLLAEPIFDQQFRGPHVDSNPGCQDMMKPLDHLRHQFTPAQDVHRRRKIISSQPSDGVAERRATLRRKTECRRLKVEYHKRGKTERGIAKRRRLNVED